MVRIAALVAGLALWLILTAPPAGAGGAYIHELGTPDLGTTAARSPTDALPFQEEAA